MIKKLNSKTVYENPWLKVREDNVRFPNGHEDIYSVVEKTDFAIVLPYENSGFYLVNQYRYPVSAPYWEFPQGTVKGEEIEPLELAHIELKEETGLVANSMLEIGYLYMAYGFSNQGFHIFLAEDLQQTEQALEITESDLIYQWFSEDEFTQMIDEGVILDAPTVAAYALYLRKIKKKL